MITKAKKIGKGYSMLVILLMVMLISPLQQLITNAKSGQISPPLTETYWTDVKVAPSGSGTSEDPYIIDSAEKLAYLVGDDKGAYRKAYFSQTADIDLGGRKWTPIGAISYSANSIHYNGNGYKISNMTIVDGENWRGLFGHVWNGTIENVNVVNPYIIGGTQVGGVTGNAEQSWIRNCQVSGGYLEGEKVGGLIGNFVGYTGGIENVSSSANIYASESAGGIIGGVWNDASGSTTHLIKNTYFTGVAKSEKNTGGIIGKIENGGTSGVIMKLDNCYSDAFIQAVENAGGLVGNITNGTATVTIQNCGFNGDMEAQAHTIVGSMIGLVSGTATLTQSFGLVDVKGGTILPFGAENVTWGDCFSYTRQSKEGKLNTYSKYKNIDGMKNFKYSPYINGGYPFPSGMFAVGGALPEQDISAYLQSYGFDSIKEFVIKTLQNSTYGTDKYIELGEYPQTYVGKELNAVLETWISANPSTKRTYILPYGTNAIIYNAYTYSDGKTYVRVPTPILNGTNYSYKNGAIATTDATWFKVEPIRWLILNYAETLKGESPVLVAEQALLGNTAWNRTLAGGNLWGNNNVRHWLNNIFYKFDLEVESNILNTAVLNNSQSSSSDGTGTTTSEYVYLLSYDEASKYFVSNEQRITSPTDFAIANKANLNLDARYKTTARPDGGVTHYWLRSAYPSNVNNVYIVDTFGNVHNYVVNNTSFGVRPVVRLKPFTT